METKEAFVNRSLKEIAEETEAWQTGCLGKEKERETAFVSLSGIPIKPLYTPEQVAGMDTLRTWGFLAKSRSLEVFTQRCTGAGSGQ